MTMITPPFQPSTVIYTLKSETGVFIEPLMQFQMAYLESFDYRTDQCMIVEAYSETSTIDRVNYLF